MLNTFLAALNPMLMLFTYMAIGYILRKTNILPKDASKIVAKLETWVFVPALSFFTMSKYCTLDSLKVHMVNIIFAIILTVLAMSLAVFLARFFTKEPSSERGIYQYSLSFGNSGFVGKPVVLALFGGAALSYFELFTIPLSAVVYTWGISVLVPRGAEKESILKRVFNLPMIATFAGILFGVTGWINYVPSFMVSTLDSLGACMGPLAMILAGITVANYSLIPLLKNKKVYAATFLRLIIIPSILVFAIWGIKELVNICFHTNIDNLVVYMTLFFAAMPLGLNTVVFPEAYGGNPETGASMALISHTLCVITIPIMFAVMSLFLGEFPAL